MSCSTEDAKDEEPESIWVWEFMPGGCGRYIEGCGRRQCGQRGTSQHMVAYIYCADCRGPAAVTTVADMADASDTEVTSEAPREDGPRCLECSAPVEEYELTCDTCDARIRQELAARANAPLPTPAPEDR